MSPEQAYGWPPPILRLSLFQLCSLAVGNMDLRPKCNAFQKGRKRGVNIGHYGLPATPYIGRWDQYKVKDSFLTFAVAIFWILLISSACISPDPPLADRSEQLLARNCLWWWNRVSTISAWTSSSAHILFWYTSPASWPDYPSHGCVLGKLPTDLRLSCHRLSALVVGRGSSGR